MDDRGERTALIAVRLLGWLFRVLLLPMARLDVERLRDVPGPGTPFILAANHRSLLDVFVSVPVVASWGRAPRVFIRGDFLEHPMLGPFLRQLGALPGGKAYGGRAVEAAHEALRTGGMLAITPEGRVPDADERPEGVIEFRSGLGRFASADGAPVLLAAMTGTDEVWPPGRRLPRVHLLPWRRPTITARFSWLEVAAGEDPGEVNRRARTRMREMLRELEDSRPAACRRPGDA